jgi:hypothetical protein
MRPTIHSRLNTAPNVVKLNPLKKLYNNQFKKQKEKKMKKFVLIMAALFAAVSMNAQVATENQKLFDNVYVGVEGGVATPLNFKNLFPLNSAAGLKIGKELTPVFGLEAEGQVFFNDNKFVRWTDTFVKGTNVGINGTINVMNFLFGYKGTPRTFEVKTNTGLGWLHFWGTSTNSLTAKTAVDINLNFGKTKAHTVFVSPGVYWNLNTWNKIQLNKDKAQFAVFVGYLYHFKTSNGTRHFKTYDIGALCSEIDRLNGEKTELTNKLNSMPKTNAGAVKKATETKAIQEIKYVVETRYVTFAKNSCELDSVARAELDKVEGIVNIYGYASPEGSETYNKELSQKRADEVAAYLRARNVGVKDVVGMGVVGITSNRIAIVHNADIDPNKK